MADEEVTPPRYGQAAFEELDNKLAVLQDELYRATQARDNVLKSLLLVESIDASSLDWETFSSLVENEINDLRARAEERRPYTAPTVTRMDSPYEGHETLPVDSESEQDSTE